MTILIGAILALVTSMLISLLFGRSKHCDVAVIAAALAEMAVVIAFFSVLTMTAPGAAPFWELSSTTFRDAMHSETLWQFISELASFVAQNCQPAEDFLVGFLAVRTITLVLEIALPVLRKRGTRNERGLHS